MITLARNKIMFPTTMLLLITNAVVYDWNIVTLFLSYRTVQWTRQWRSVLQKSLRRHWTNATWSHTGCYHYCLSKGVPVTCWLDESMSFPALIQLSLMEDYQIWLHLTEFTHCA